MFRKLDTDNVNALVEGIMNPQFETEDEDEWTAEFMRISRLPMTESEQHAFDNLSESKKTDMEKALSPIQSKQKSMRSALKNAKGEKKGQVRRELQKLAAQVKAIRKKFLGGAYK